MKKPLTPAQELKKAEAKAKRESLERAFALQCRQYELTPIPQFKLSYCDYVWDFAFPIWLLLVEVNGGIHAKSGHSTGKGIQRDYKKGNIAVMHGWRQLTFSADDIHSGEAIQMIRKYMSQHSPF